MNDELGKIIEFVRKRDKKHSFFIEGHENKEHYVLSEFAIHNLNFPLPMLSPI